MSDLTKPTIVNKMHYSNKKVSYISLHYTLDHLNIGINI